MLVEIIAAISGLYYVRHCPNDKIGRMLVWFLWFTVGVETFGMYAPIAYYSEYRIFGFVKDTAFWSNEWWFNLYIIVSYLFYTYFFYSLIRSEKIRKALRGLMIFFLLSTPIYMVFTDVFFDSLSRYTILLGTAMVLMAILVFCYELLQSDRILSLKTYLPFYVAVALLAHTLANAPLDLLMSYFNLSTGNEYFVNARAKVLMFSNIFMYLTYSIGFIRCSRANRSY